MHEIRLAFLYVVAMVSGISVLAQPVFAERFSLATLCNTSAQMIAVISLVNEGIEPGEAALAINKDAGSDACTTEYFIGEQMEVVQIMRGPNDTIAITKFKVTKVMMTTPFGLRPVALSNVEQYGAVIIAKAEDS